MAGPAGFEPATPGLGGQSSIQAELWALKFFKINFKFHLEDTEVSTFDMLTESSKKEDRTVNIFKAIIISRNAT